MFMHCYVQKCPEYLPNNKTSQYGPITISTKYETERKYYNIREVAVTVQVSACGEPVLSLYNVF